MTDTNSPAALVAAGIRLAKELADAEAERDALRESVHLWADETYDEGIAVRMRDFLERTK